MSTLEPWTADRELTLDGAARAIHEAVPELASADVRLLGKGWDFDAYEADGRWVFRFPRRAEEQDRLRRDLLILPWVAERIEAPVPRYAWGALRASAFPYTFSGYAKLRGVLASATDPARVDLTALGRSLGGFYRDLHALEPTPGLVAAAGLAQGRYTPGPFRDHMRKHLAAFREAAPKALAARAVRFFDDPGLVPPAYDGPPRLLHDDLHAEHLLLDPGAPGRITGLLDWSDAVMGDPARDLGYIYSWGGEPILRAMLGTYGEADPGFEARARFHGICVAFFDWVCYVQLGNELCAQQALRTIEAALPDAAQPG